MSRRILVIEDEQDTLAMYTFILERAGFEIEGTVTALAGLRQAYRSKPDLILLDILLPDLDGWQTCRRFRELTDVPIMLLSVLDSPAHIEKGLALGADSYLTKPIGASELVARVKAVLRRAYGNRVLGVAAKLRYRDIIVDVATREVRVGSKKVKLRPGEFKLLVYLLQHQHQTIPFTELLNQVWGPGYNQEHLRQYILYLRRKIEPDPANPIYIHNIWGVGYRFG